MIYSLFVTYRFIQVNVINFIAMDIIIGVKSLYKSLTFWFDPFFSNIRYLGLYNWTTYFKCYSKCKCYCIIGSYLVPMNYVFVVLLEKINEMKWNEKNASQLSGERRVYLHEREREREREKWGLNPSLSKLEAELKFKALNNNWINRDKTWTEIFIGFLKPEFS